MPHLSLDYLIVYAFLLITLVVGVRASKGIEHMRTYAVANKSFGTLALVLTYLATNIAGASVFNATAAIFADGVIATVALLALPFTFLFRAFFVAPHAVRFPKCLTMGDLVGTLYGPTSKLIAGLLGLFTTFCIATMELSMLGEVGQSLLGWPRVWSIVIGGMLLACYTAYGGIKSVTATDVFQFLVLLIGIPILAIITVEEAGGMKQVFTHVPAEKLHVFAHPQFIQYLAMALIWLIPLGMVDPCEMQRLFMGKTRKQLRDQYLIVAVFDPALQLTLMLIGLAGIVLYPQLKGLQLIPHIVHHLIPTGLKGLIMAGLLGIVTSTIDSYLHAMGLTAVHDILQPALGNRLKENVEIRYTRYATVLLSCVAIYTALYTSNFLGLLLLSLEFAGPLLMCPIIAGMMGVKPDKHAFYGALGVTLVAISVSKSLFATGADHWVAFTGALANGVTFFAIHWFRNKGLALVSWEQGIAYKYNPQKVTGWRSIKQLIPTPSRIVAYSQRQVAKYGAPYTLLGVFCCLNYTFPYFMWKHETTSLYETMLYLRVCGAVLCGLLVVKDKWPAAYLAYLPSFWHFTLLYCLPFTSTVMFLLTKGSIEWLINVAITIMFLIVLVDWRSFILLTLMGIGVGGVFYQLALGPIHLRMDFSTGYLLVYTLVFSTVIALLFARRREQHLEAKLREISAHYHATRPIATADPEPAIYRIAAMIERNVQEVNASYHADTYTHNLPGQEDAPHTAIDCLQYFFPTAIEVIQQGEQLMPHLVTVLQQNYINPYLSFQSLKACVDTVLQAFGKNQVDYVQDDLTADYAVYASWPHLQYAIIHMVQFLQANLKKEPMHLWITHQQGIHMRLAGKAVAASLLKELFALFPAKGSTHHLGLAISRVLIEAQGGSLLYQTHAASQQPYTEFTIALPPATS
jgi:Na+/proline symporter